jgi:hypothetical protein
MHSYTLNANNAKAVGVAARIDQLGAYVGTFTRAEALSSDKGTQGVEFSFKSNEGQSADYLTLWTINNQGADLYGRKVLDALMVCMRVRGIAAKQAKIKKWDAQRGAEVEVLAQIFPELMNKPIGLLLVREEYEKDDGTTAWKMVIVGAFDPGTHQTPREILENVQQPEQLKGMISALRDRPLRKKSGQGGSQGQGGGRPAPNFADMDDDIPFK